jgi:hypothetical protein
MVLLHAPSLAKLCKIVDDVHRGSFISEIPAWKGSLFMALVEKLESRELLSVTPFVKVKPTIPNVVGTYTGPSTQLQPTHESPEGGLIFNVITESPKGVLSGTLFSPGGSGLETLVGKVNLKGKFTGKVSYSDKVLDSNIAGTFSGTTVSGTYHAVKHKGGNGHASSGTFSFALETT